MIFPQVEEKAPQPIPAASIPPVAVTFPPVIGAGKNGPCSSIVLENCEIHVPGDGKGGLSGANGIVAGSVVPDLGDGEEMREKGVRVEGI